jgi:hypothetical protein
MKDDGISGLLARRENCHHFLAILQVSSRSLFYLLGDVDLISSPVEKQYRLSGDISVSIG